MEKVRLTRFSADTNGDVRVIRSDVSTIESLPYRNGLGEEKTGTIIRYIKGGMLFVEEDPKTVFALFLKGEK